jgi:hypothetical protein
MPFHSLLVTVDPEVAIFLDRKLNLLSLKFEPSVAQSTLTLWLKLPHTKSRKNIFIKRECNSVFSNALFVILHLLLTLLFIYFKHTSSVDITNKQIYSHAYPILNFTVKR